MTLDEVIERYTRNAEYERTHGSLQGCLEFKQLAEWLKDYKRLLEQEPKTGYREYNDIYDHYLCGNCKTVVMDYDNFCPNCGAKMVEPQTESEVQE